MNRKKFFKGVLGTVIATVVGKRLDFIPMKKKKPVLHGVGVWEQLKEPHKYMHVKKYMLEDFNYIKPYLPKTIDNEQKIILQKPVGYSSSNNSRKDTRLDT